MTLAISSGDCSRLGFLLTAGNFHQAGFNNALAPQSLDSVAAQYYVEAGDRLNERSPLPGARPPCWQRGPQFGVAGLDAVFSLHRA